MAEEKKQPTVHESAPRPNTAPGDDRLKDAPAAVQAHQDAERIAELNAQNRAAAVR